MLNIAIIIGSTRPGRHGKAVADWAYDIAKRREDARFEIVDIADYNLPLLDEPMGAASANTRNPIRSPGRKKSNRLTATFSLLRNITMPFRERSKTPSIIYITNGTTKRPASSVTAEAAACAAENLRLIAGELMLSVVRAQVGLTFHGDFENYTVFKPAPHQEGVLNTMLDQVIAWSGALKTLRE